MDKLASFNIKGNYKLSRREDEGEEVKLHKTQNTLETERTLDGNKVKEHDGVHGVKFAGTSKKKNENTLITTKGKITFHDENEGNNLLHDRKNHGSKLTSKSNVYSSRSYQDRPFIDIDTGFHRQVSTVPKVKLRNPTFLEKYSTSKSKNKVKAPTRFNSLRSLKDIFFGRTKNKNLQGSPHDRTDRSINFETRTTLMPSDSLDLLPINYHVDEIERDGDDCWSWNHRRLSDETKNSSLPRHSSHSPNGSRYWPENSTGSFYSGCIQTKNNRNLMRAKDHFQADTRNLYDTKRPVFHRGISKNSLTHSTTTSPEFYRRTKGHEFLQQKVPRNWGLVGGKLQEGSREQYDNYHYNIMPFKQPQSWASQREKFYHGQNPLHDNSFSGPSWHPWGRRVLPSVQPSREQSVREAFASFVTETPYSEQASTNTKVVYFPELDYSSASEDGAYTPPLRSYRSEPTFHSNNHNEPFNSNNRRKNQISKQMYPSDNSLFKQEYDGRMRQSQKSPSNRQTHLQSTQSRSPACDIPSYQKRTSLEKSKKQEIFNSEDTYHVHQESRSSLGTSRITDYVDCEDIPSSVMPPGHRVISGPLNKGHFQQFDHILSTANVTNPDDQLKLESPRLTPVALQHGHFLMKKKSDDQTTLTRSRSLDSILDYSPRNTHISGKNSSQHEYVENVQQDLMTKEKSHILSAGKKLEGTDYSILGVCSHVETMLNKNALRPGIRFTFNNKHSPRYLQKVSFLSFLLL